MIDWIRYRVSRDTGASDAEALEPPFGPVAAPRELPQIVSREGCLRLDRVLERLRGFEAEFARVDSTTGRGLEVVAFAADEDCFLLLRPVQRHSGGLSRLAYVYSALARSRDAVLFTDSRAAILAASSRWLELYGLRPHEVLGRNPRIVNSRLLPRSFFRALWRGLAKRSGGSWSGELVNRRASGELVRVWQTITTFHDSAGFVAGYLGVTRDLTPYREVLNRLVAGARRVDHRRRQEDERAGSLVRRISDPIDQLRICLERAVAASSDTDALRSDLSSALAWSQTLERTVREWRETRNAASSGHNGAVDRFHLRRLLRTECDLLSEFMTRREIRLCITEAGTAVPSFGDEESLGRAISSLIRTCVELMVDDQLSISLASEADGSSQVAFELESRRPGADEPASKTSAELETELLPALDGDTLSELGAARRIVEDHGGSLVWMAGTGGRIRLELRIPLVAESLESRIWAIAIFDPDETIWPDLVERLRPLAAPVFVAHRERDFLEVCERELPNAMVFSESVAAEMVIPTVRAGAEGPTLRPAVLRVARVGTGDAIVVVSSHGPRSLVPLLGAAFADQVARKVTRRRQAQ